MNSSCELSVIMGVYNTKSPALLQRAIASILHQTYADFELIICDDGSTDDTYSLLQEHARADSRIRLVRHDKNLGLAAALNTCIGLARGRFIARHDADDWSDPERFGQQLGYLKSHSDIAMVGSNISLCDEYGNVWGERVFPALPQKQDFLFTLPFLHGALVFRRQSLVAAGCYHVAKVTRRCEDYDLLMRMYALGMQGANLPDKLYLFLEDAAARKRRKYRYRVDEAIMRWHGFGALGLLPKAFPYVLKPLVVGLIPAKLLYPLKKTRRF